jgi:hypothetical protein
MVLVAVRRSGSHAGGTSMIELSISAPSIALTAPEPNGVTVMLSRGQWIVRVVENGRVNMTAFGLEQHAEVFAAAQRMRLGVA